MPLIKTVVSVDVPANTQDELLSSISRIVTAATGKPEAYMMVTFEKSNIRMSGTNEPAAQVDVRGIGDFNREMNSTITRDICRLLQETLKIQPKRVYVTFTSVAADHWGWNGATFA